MTGVAAATDAAETTKIASTAMSAAAVSGLRVAPVRIIDSRSSLPRAGTPGVRVEAGERLFQDAQGDEECALRSLVRCPRINSGSVGTSPGGLAAATRCQRPVQSLVYGAPTLLRTRSVNDRPFGSGNLASTRADPLATTTEVTDGLRIPSPACTRNNRCWRPTGSEAPRTMGETMRTDRRCTCSNRRSAAGAPVHHPDLHRSSPRGRDRTTR